MVYYFSKCATKDKSENIKERFYEKLEHVFDQFQRCHMKMLLGDFNAKAEREDIFKQTVVNILYVLYFIFCNSVFFLFHMSNVMYLM
jgi:exonuclease III